MTKRAIVIIAGGVVIVVLASLAFGFWLVRPLPPLAGAATLSGLQQNVSVSFDERAVPYIEGRSDEDVYQAQGYVTARDRMFQMDMLRRLAYGRMSEILGSAWLKSDRLMETLGISALAYAELHQLSPPARAALDAYARGVNNYLSQYASNLPHEFLLLGYAPSIWSAQDSLAILKYNAYQIDESWRLDDLRQRIANRLGNKLTGQLFSDALVPYGLPVKPEQTRPAAGDTKSDTTWRPSSDQVDRLLSSAANAGSQARADAASGACLGSTTWAVPGGATDTHGAMLACNKDGVLAYPCPWYLCSLNSQALHVAGACLPGVPSVMVGRNEAIAFGSSALKADVQDIYLERFHLQFDSAYQTANGWVQAAVETRAIPVRFSGDIEHKVVTTAHGPLLLRTGAMAVSLSWTGFDTAKPSYQALFDLNYASDTDQALKALKKYSDPPMLYVLADRDGNVCCQAAGLIPLRQGGAPGTMLNCGWHNRGNWVGYVPFEQLPHTLTAANDGQATPCVAANQNLQGSQAASAPLLTANVLLGHQFDPPYRANRLLALLSQRKKPLTLSDMVALSGDQYSTLSPLLADALSSAASQQQIVDRNSLQASDLLKKWDGQLQPGGNEASIYESFVQTMARRITEPILGRELSSEYLNRYPQWLCLVQSVLQNKAVSWMPPEERTFDTFISTTLSQSLKALRITFDTSNLSQWTWGQIHEAVFAPTAKVLPTPLGALSKLPPLAVGGAPECVNSLNVALDPKAVSYVALSGPQERMIVDMSDRDKFYQSISSGQSGCLLSAHHADQVKSWAAVDFMPIAFSSDQLIRQSQHRLMLEPE